ncbi:MAG: DUF4382 domain-containing protein [Marinilabiliaceae bacterium]|nr:DUF4382 domain-containing protein [Marinilabiliaceae bacterium]
MKKVFLTALASLVVFAFIFTSCSSDDNDAVSTTGKLKIQLTDAPFPTDLVAEANVIIDKIEIREKNEDNEGRPFITLSEEVQEFNLLDLTNGVTASLVDLEIEVGSYDLIRLYVAEASVKLNDGTEFDLTIPSGAQTGIKVFIDPSIQVAGGLTTDLLLDFDVSKSFVPQGGNDSPEGIKGFHFKPVIKASNLSTAGRLIGAVNDAESVAIDGAQISIIAADTVYTTTFTGEDGGYAVLGIEAGNYGVEFAKEGYQTVTVESVEIVAGNATTQNAELTAEEVEE